MGLEDTVNIVKLLPIHFQEVSDGTLPTMPPSWIGRLHTFNEKLPCIKENILTTP